MPRGRRAPSVDRVIPPEHATADFHAHTLRSDGLLAPVDLARAAVAAGVRVLAITDHDTLAGVRELVAEPGGLPPGLELVAGVEINSVGRGLGLPDGELHVVGLGVDPADEAFEAVLSAQRGRRRERFEAMATRLREAGAPVDAQIADVDYAQDDALGRPTLARALVAAGFATSVQDAFTRLVGHGCPGYVPRVGIGPAEAVRAIRVAGGLPVLAHFGVVDRHEGLVRELVEAGLGGIETHHRSFGASTIAAVSAAADRLRLIRSGGTDFHGDECTYAEAIGETWIPRPLVERMRAALGATAPADTAGPADAAAPAVVR